MPSWRRGNSLVAILLLAAATGCRQEPADAVALGYVAPASVNLRPSVTDRNNSVAVLKHGDRVQILEVRRRFVKIRSKDGAEGWIDALQLLTPEQMHEIRKAAAHALTLPSEGSATVFEALNIHLEPSRQSAAFARIPETGSVEVLAHQLAPKLAGPPKIPVFTVPQSAAAAARKQRKERKTQTNLRLPPPPPPPKAPDNWFDLSSGRIAGPSKPAPRPVPEEPKKPVLLEDWSLVRTKDNQCGWVLSRNLIMSIPDEVAQYAEGKRITSYFDLGVVHDEEKGPRHNWLWTTSSSQEQFDFDSWRVFIWNRRRHRYETSYRERDVEGYFPVHVEPPDESGPGRSFDLILRDDNGKLKQRRYNFDGVRVHLRGEELYDPGKSARELTSASPGAEPSQGNNWFRRLWSNLQKRLGRAH